jgi:hypothetical protein
MYARLCLTMAATALISFSIELVCSAGRVLGVALEVVPFLVVMMKMGLLKFSTTPTSHKVLHVRSQRNGWILLLDIVFNFPIWAGRRCLHLQCAWQADEVAGSVGSVYFVSGQLA